jgi:FkbM family methyltransferase
MQIPKRTRTRSSKLFHFSLSLIAISILVRVTYRQEEVFDLHGVNDIDASVKSEPNLQPGAGEVQVSKVSSFPKPPTCSNDELMKIRHQLPPEVCVEQYELGILFTHLCGLTTATKCPKTTWLDDYYGELQRNYSSTNVIPPGFLGISVGCNKGFDAINTLRMGTFDDTINKASWKQAMTYDGSSLHQSVCNQDAADDTFEVLEPYQKESTSNKNIPHPEGEMHCIEPMPQTYEKLNRSAEVLGYSKKGLKVTHGAISKESGEMLFHTGGAPGVENLGLASCGTNTAEECEAVKVYSLYDFVQQHVKAESSRPINHLSIDVEGFDGDVLLGATTDLLKRVEYLEFEYNWMGSWRMQHLYDIVEMLDTNSGLTCYWAGIDRLWRITDCWMSYYDIHVWSNVACVNRHLVPRLASKMEDIFQRTLDDTRQWTKNARIAGQLQMFQKKYSDHFLMSLADDKLKSKYLPPQEGQKK